MKPLIYKAFKKQVERLGYGRQANRVLERIMVICVLKPSVLKFLMEEVDLNELVKGKS
jgi:hypothetical protein